MDDFPLYRQRLDSVHDSSRVQLRIEAALATLMGTATDEALLKELIVPKPFLENDAAAYAQIDPVI